MTISIRSNLVSRRLLLLACATVAGTALVGGSLHAKEFTFSAKANERLAKKLKIPVYFALPASARATLPQSFDTTDVLVDFKHPDAKNATGDVGLRIINAKRAGMAQRLANSGLVKTGDILLTFRTEWGGSGAYPNVQMGISHTGIAYVKDGVVHNLDNPLTEEYLGAGMRADLTSEHYRTLDYIHIIRPRELTEAQRANLLAWSSRLNSSAKRIYPSQVSFNSDYNAPKFKPGKPIDFVKHLGQIALGQNPPGNVDMFCSEFAWSVLALRDCDPSATGDDFKGGGIPACVKPVMQPMEATGNYLIKRNRTAQAGFADGPLMVIDALKLPKVEQTALLKSVFVAGNTAKLSAGHKKVAEEMQPKFAKLEDYYVGMEGNMLQKLKARVTSAAFNRAIPENYSPTSYLINTLLPSDNVNRTMDYVATIVIE
jgi:hypothetical protein